MSSPPSITMDQLAAAYLKIRNVVQQKEHAHTQEIEALKHKQDAIATEMRERMKSEQSTSMKTPHGTVIMTVKTRYFPQDWDAFKKFIKENDALDLLERRVAQGNIAKFIEDNPENVPYGLSSSSEYSITVRKPTKD